MNKNRGMFLEELINRTIIFYKENEIGIFHKKNLDINFTAIDSVGGKPKIRNGFIKHKSTADYYGIYGGKFIAFEAKSTNLQSLPINNIKKHQMKYLQDIHKHNGVAFIVVYFAKFNRVFIIFIENMLLLEENKKSISLDFAIDNGLELTITYPGIIDFVEHIKIKKVQKDF